MLFTMTMMADGVLKMGNGVVLKVLVKRKKNFFNNVTFLVIFFIITKRNIFF